MKRVITLLVLLALSLPILIGCSAAPQPAASPAQPQLLDRANGKPQESMARSGEAGSAAPQAPGTASSSAQMPWDRMIIRTASLTLTVKDVENSLTAIRDVATSAGGWVAQSSTRYEGERQVANVTIQVPAAAYDATVNEIRKLAIRVESEVSSSQDVTEEFTDLQSQVRNLQATEAALLKLLDRAVRMEDILALQRELTNTRGQIEKLQGRLNYLQRRTDMSTISVSLLLPGVAKPGDRPAWNPLATAQQAWKAFSVFLQVAADILIVAVIFLWWLLPVGAILWWLLRLRPKRPTTNTGGSGS